MYLHVEIHAPSLLRGTQIRQGVAGGQLTRGRISKDCLQTIRRPPERDWKKSRPESRRRYLHTKA
jgi:hypothetical protein